MGLWVGNGSAVSGQWICNSEDCQDWDERNHCSLHPSPSLGSIMATSRTHVDLMPGASQGMYRGHLCAGGHHGEICRITDSRSHSCLNSFKNPEDCQQPNHKIPWGIILVPVPAVANDHRAAQNNTNFLSHSSGGWTSEKGLTWPQTRSGQGCLSSQALGRTHSLPFPGSRGAHTPVPGPLTSPEPAAAPLWAPLHPRVSSPDPPACSASHFRLRDPWDHIVDNPG